MHYNFLTNQARDFFANKIIEVICPTDYSNELTKPYRKEFTIPVFLAGGVIPSDDWRKEVVKYFQENWKEEKGIIFFNPVRDDFDINDHEDTKRQIEWEFNYLNRPDILVSFYFPDTQFPQQMSFYELGRALAIHTQYGGSNNHSKHNVYVAVNKNFRRKTDVIVQGTLANYGMIPCEVEDAEEFAVGLMNYIKMVYNTSIPIESTPDRCCGSCKYYTVYPTHGSHEMGYCCKKSNVFLKGCRVKCFEDVVSEDGLCEQFERKEDEKLCLKCNHYQADTLNHGYCDMDENKTIRCITDTCIKNI